MAVDAAVDQALALKKRARRRLVGAIALVLLMLIILPNVLKDRAQEVLHAPITLTMPEATEPAQVSESSTENPVADQIAAPQSPAEPTLSHTVPTESIETISEPTPAPPPISVLPKNAPIPEKPITSSPKVEKSNIPSQNVIKPSDVKATRFLIQVGVFSDAENVKKLQAKISEAGFSSRTAKLVTPKGEKIRLRVGSFVTRDAAAEALKKLESHGLSGMVLIDD